MPCLRILVKTKYALLARGRVTGSLWAMDFYNFHTSILSLDDLHGNAVDAQADPDFRDIPQMFKDQTVECLGAFDGQVY